MTKRVAVRMDSGIAHVKLCRAEKMNALDRALLEALVETGRELANDPALRAVLLSGEGRVFCAGLDMDIITAILNGETENIDALLAPPDDGPNLVQQAVLVWRDLPVPVICAVHGAAYGGGFQIMLGADMRYAAPDCIFSIMEIKWGLVPDMAGIPLMAELARADVIRELTYSGRSFGAEEALAHGLITRVTPDPLAAARESAEAIAGKSPAAIRAAKRLLGAGIPNMTARLRTETREQQALIGSPDQQEAVRANLEKRPPRFR